MAVAIAQKLTFNYMTTTTFPEIIFENTDYLVINKPAGLAVHGGGNIKDETLADLLIKKYPKT